MTELAAISAVAVLSTVALCFSLLRFIRQEREAAIVERMNLLQRIQAPEYAAVQHYNDHQETVAPPAVNPELDDDYWVSKDDLAEQEARNEVTSGH